jgi:DNA-binding MarR family transcriptional regulator
MRPARKLTSAELNDMRSLRRHGYTISRLARIFGISQSRAQRVLRQLMGAAI